VRPVADVVPRRLGAPGLHGVFDRYADERPQGGEAVFRDQ
jgi:hypothetical protein